jgi:hypothetical protein
MRYLLTLATLALALVAPGSALAGGWATVGVAPLPDGTAAGATWSPEITILQHGRTPLDGLSPSVTIVDAEGGTHSFPATPSGSTGVYDASVVFPDAGDWRVVVDSGFGVSRLTLGPVTIRGDASGGPSGSDGSFAPTSGLVASGAALALLAAAALAVRRVRRVAPASR